MNNLDEIFWNSSIDNIKRGYICTDSNEEYVCLICGERFTKGIIYKEDELYMDAEKAVKNHILRKHSSVFDYLLNMDKKLTGLTDIQRSLLEYFYNGESDDKIAKTMGSSTSTIRNHRFSLKQHQKQAKVFLALMELLDESKSTKQSDFVSIRKTAKMVDDRYAITEEENEKYLKKYFENGLDGPLSKFPLKEKRKIIVLMNIIKRFDSTKKYTEKEVNEILKKIYPDYVTIRRYLIEYGFMDRLIDGSKYWVKI